MGVCFLFLWNRTDSFILPDFSFTASMESDSISFFFARFFYRVDGVGSFFFSFFRTFLFARFFFYQTTLVFFRPFFFSDRTVFVFFLFFYHFFWPVFL
jgi:hypothetical protein